MTQPYAERKQVMTSKRNKVRTAAEGKLHICVTISGAGAEDEELTEAFNMTLESLRRIKRKLRKRGVESVCYKIEKSGD